MPVFSKKKADQYYCKIYTMDAELQFTIEVSNSTNYYYYYYSNFNLFRQRLKVVQYFHLFVKQWVLENIGILV
jgi:hypothetical protein